MDWRAAAVALIVAPTLVVQAAEQAPAPAKPTAPAAQAAAAPAKPVTQPKIEARQGAGDHRRAGLNFRDLNRNGTLDRYEDWRLAVDQRVADIVAQDDGGGEGRADDPLVASRIHGPNGEVLGLPAAGGRGGATGAPRNRAFEGGPNPNNVDPMGSANPRS